MLERIYIILKWTWLILLAGNSLAQQSVEVRISATVPPLPCDFPELCEAAPQSAGSKVTIEGNSVRYVGSRPAVTQHGDVIMVIF